MRGPTPFYECRRVPKGSIRVDGILDDPAWENILSIRGFMLSDGSGPATRQTEVRMCWDERYLYLAFGCYDPDIWGTMLNRDDHIWEEEVVEAFIDPDSDLERYYEFQTSPRGVMTDLLIHNVSGSNKRMKGDITWNCEGWLVGVQVDGTLDDRTDVDKGWTVEWAIPFASIPGAPNTPPKDGDTWRMNFYRIDRTPAPEHSCWSPTLAVPPDYHIPSRFGTIIFRE